MCGFELIEVEVRLKHIFEKFFHVVLLLGG